MSNVIFLFTNDSYEVAQIRSNERFIVFANKTDIDSGRGSIFLMNLITTENEEHGTINGQLSPFTTTPNRARTLSSNLNTYLNTQKKDLWLPRNKNWPDVSAKFRSTQIDQSNGNSNHGVVWHGISTPNWNSDCIW